MLNQNYLTKEERNNARVDALFSDIPDEKLILIAKNGPSAGEKQGQSYDFLWDFQLLKIPTMRQCLTEYIGFSI